MDNFNQGNQGGQYGPGRQNGPGWQNTQNNGQYAPPPQPQNAQYAPPPQGGQGWQQNPGGHQVAWHADDWAADAQANKVWGVLAYVLFLIPLLAGPKTSKFTRYHTNQGLGFFILWLVLTVALNVVRAIVVAATFGSAGVYGLGLVYGYGWGGFMVFSLIGLVIGIVIIILFILGVVHAVKGERKPLPLTGKIDILKVGP